MTMVHNLSTTARSLSLLALFAMFFFSSTTDATSVIWAITGVRKCNATCGPYGVRHLDFGCFRRNAPAVVALSQTSPLLFAAKSASGRLPDSSCVGIPLPKTRTVECQGLPADCADLLVRPSAAPSASQAAATEGGRGGYSWRWNFDSGKIGCSARCNHAGLLSVPIDCVDSRGAPSNAEICEQRVSARPDLALPCYTFAGCNPEWKAGAWGPCSRKCGLGEIERKIECYQLVDSANGPYYKKSTGQCSQSDDKPHSMEYCVVNKTCPPFYAVKLGKCQVRVSGDNTGLPLCNETGVSIRTNLTCVQITADLLTRKNDTVPIGPEICRAAGLIQPKRHFNCQLDAVTLKQHGIKCLNPNVALEPQFSQVSNILVQIERRESLQVNCGQSATVIPGTQVRLHCQVANFKPENLKWKRQGSEDLAPTGSACKRICVVDGDLVIPKFKPKDSGIYQVMAGNKTATLSLHSHTAYEAYIQAYLPRMMLIQSNPKIRHQTKSFQLDTPTKDNLLWMTGPWSACSVPCGGSGHKTRSVYCEQLQTSLYTIVDDSVCEVQLNNQTTKPVESEPCGSHTCPVWQTSEWDSKCSVERCYSPGFSLRTRQVRCVNQASQPLPDIQCGHEKKPESVHMCRNPNCKPKWQMGNWSECSVSCGAYGFTSRQIQCIWEPTSKPAGFACETAKQDPPKSFKACYNGPCGMLGCVDLSKVCTIYQASALCAHGSLRRNCCKTCNEYQQHVYNNLATRVSKTTV